MEGIEIPETEKGEKRAEARKGRGHERQMRPADAAAGLPQGQETIGNAATDQRTGNRYAVMHHEVEQPLV